MTRPLALAVASALGVALIAAVVAGQAPTPTPAGNIEVKLCDNETTTNVPANQPATRENGERSPRR
jgi:hypothetical protein